MSGRARLPSGDAKLAGVMGWPVSHSRSPRLHGIWLDRYDIDGCYVPLAVPPDCIELAVRALSVLGFRGVNVTVPYKETVLRLVDRITPLADRIGAANTLTVLDDGSILADNTDGIGFIEHLRAIAPDWQASSGSVILIGAGGSAKAVAVALEDAGVTDLRIANRTVNRAGTLARGLAGTVHVGSLDDISRWQSDATLMINTTTLGMTGQPPLPVNCAGLPATALVYDLVYAPLRTPLLENAVSLGLRTIDGLGMLLHQAVPGFEAWFGHRPEVDQALRAAVAMDHLGSDS